MKYAYRTIIGLALILIVVAVYLMFTAAFGPFTLFHAIGIGGLFAASYYLGKAVVG
jgi:hypothetical protein